MTGERRDALPEPSPEYEPPTGMAFDKSDPLAAPTSFRDVHVTRVISLAHIRAVLSDPATVEAVRQAISPGQIYDSEPLARAALAVVAQQIGAER